MTRRTCHSDLVFLRLPLGDLHYHDSGSALASHSVLVPIFQILGLRALNRDGVLHYLVWPVTLTGISVLSSLLYRGAHAVATTSYSRARMVWSRLEELV